MHPLFPLLLRKDRLRLIFFFPFSVDERVRARPAVYTVFSWLCRHDANKLLPCTLETPELLFFCEAARRPRGGRELSLLYMEAKRAGSFEIPCPISTVPSRR